MTCTSGLVAFLTARLDEDEQRALHVKHTFAATRLNEPQQRAAADGAARALDEVEAKRGILALHETQRGYHGRPDGEFCACQDADGVLTGVEPCETKRLLASVYRSHPDWREDWTA